MKRQEIRKLTVVAELMPLNQTKLKFDLRSLIQEMRMHNYAGMEWLLHLIDWIDSGLLIKLNSRIEDIQFRNET